MMHFSLFLAGRTLRARGLQFSDLKSDSSETVALNFVWPQVGFSKNSRSLSERIITERAAFADGGLTGQPLLGSTLVRTRQAIWCGDCDSLQIADCLNENFADHLCRLATNGSVAAETPVSLSVFALQVSKDLSDSAALFEKVVYAVFEQCRLEQQTRGSPGSGFPSVHLEIIGALGGRRDHEWATLREVEFVFFGTRYLELAEDFAGTQGDLLETLKSLRFCVVVQPGIVFSQGDLSFFGLPLGLPLSLFANQRAGSGSPSMVKDADALECGFDLSGLACSGKVNLKRPSHGLSNMVTGSHVLIRNLDSGARKQVFSVVFGLDEGEGH